MRDSSKKTTLIFPAPASELDEEYLPAVYNWAIFCEEIGADPYKILTIAPDSAGRSLVRMFDAGEYRGLYYYKENLPYGNEMVWTAEYLQKRERGEEIVNTNPFSTLGAAKLNKTISELERARNNLKTLRGELPTTSVSYQIIDAAIFDIEKVIKGVKENIWATVMKEEGDNHEKA